MGGELPKVTVKTREAPLIHHVLSTASMLAPELVVIVTGYMKEVVEKTIEDGIKQGIFSFPRLSFVVQESQMGTGDAVRCALPELNNFEGIVLILCGDVPLLTPATLLALCNAHYNHNNTITVLTFSPSITGSYGRIVRNPITHEVLKIVEFKDCTAEERVITEVNSGVYAVDSSFIGPAVKNLQNNNSQGEYYLTDIVSRAVNEGQRVGTYLGINSNEFLGVNSQLELAEVDRILLNEQRNRFISTGVILEAPDTFFADSSVVIASGARVGPNVILKGNTTIGEGVVIEGSALIIDTKIDVGALIKFGVRAESSYIGVKASVGPFAHLRSGSFLNEKVKVGNFVETKNAVLYEEVAASHLSYLGDCEIGKKSNIGAGTITCNFDGANKHQTNIGENVFIGSNSSLIAPITVGSGATIGAGSVIQNNVPSKALAVTRSPLTLRAEYQRKQKPPTP
jgi:bifunctional UDP-N-acetylglucosamine pyrophosphorylase/glucosamine-1-phosphate N-acetyltransferase